MACHLRRSRAGIVAFHLGTEEGAKSKMIYSGIKETTFPHSAFHIQTPLLIHFVWQLNKTSEQISIDP